MGDFNTIGVKATDTPTFDAFDRLRVSNPVTVFDSKQIADTQPLFWLDEQLSGSGTSTAYNTNQASTTIAVGTGAAGVRVRQTKRRFNYQPGKSQLIITTGVLGAGVTGITKNIGLFDDDNGLFFQLAGTTLNVVKRTYTSGSAVDTAVAQSAWSVDKMDGTGVSGITLDTTKTQIFFIDFEWLGVGRVRMGVVVAGIFHCVHEFLHANVLSVVYMSTPNLPVRYEIRNTGVAGTGTELQLVHICASVSSEGGLELTGFHLSVDRDTTSLVTANNSSLYPLIAIRLKDAYLGALIVPTGIAILTTSTTDFRWALILNPTVTGTALSFTSVTNSAVEAQVNTTNATTVSGGTLLSSGYARGDNASGGSILVQLQNGLLIGQKNLTGSNKGDILVLAVARITGTTETFYGGISWRETV